MKLPVWRKTIQQIPVLTKRTHLLFFQTVAKEKIFSPVMARLNSVHNSHPSCFLSLTPTSTFIKRACTLNAPKGWGRWIHLAMHDYLVMPLTLLLLNGEMSKRYRGKAEHMGMKDAGHPLQKVPAF